MFSQPLPHLRLNRFIISKTFATFLDQPANRFKQQTLPTVNKRDFFMNILCVEYFFTQKVQQNAALG
jgi:hypothetical protein